MPGRGKPCRYDPQTRMHSRAVPEASGQARWQMRHLWHFGGASEPVWEDMQVVGRPRSQEGDRPRSSLQQLQSGPGALQGFCHRPGSRRALPQEGAVAVPKKLITLITAEPQLSMAA